MLHILVNAGEFYFASEQKSLNFVFLFEIHPCYLYMNIVLMALIFITLAEVSNSEILWSFCIFLNHYRHSQHLVFTIIL